MTYQSLYRRYRPQRFSELRGQEHLVSALQNAVRENRVGHAYLFSGPRGTGKTSTARILAKVLNCTAPVDGEPCGVCESCVAIEQGTSFDVHELDAASNNGVDAIRDLITRSAMGTPGRTKVYILDEVHMLSAGASNALLKTLEEPPPHVVFVLATTDPQKVLPTIRSRTQHFEVHLLSAEELTALAEFVIADAGLEVPPGAVDYVVRAGAGSARDMESALDQVAAAGSIPDDADALDELVEALCERDTGRGLIAVDAAIAGGRGPRVLGELLIGRLRDVFLASMQADLARLPDRDRARIADQAARLGPAGATRALEVLGEAFVGIQDAPDQRIPLEVALVRLTRPEADLSLAALADRVSRLEQGTHLGGAPAAAAPTSGAGSGVGSPAAVTEADVEAEARDAPAPDDDAAPEATAPGRPSASARQVLQDRKRARSGSRPAPTTPRPPSPAAPTFTPPAVTPSIPSPPSLQSTAPGVMSDEGSADEPGPEQPSAPAASTGAASVPSRDELTLAWGDTILGSLAPRTKAFFAAGRFLEGTAGTAVFGLPNPTHMQKCEKGRPEVEAALTAYFGRPVTLRLAVDADPGPAPSPMPGGGPAPEPVAEEHEIDLAELTDATDVGATSVDRVRELFPGAELVDPS
jgi:DNA polymerase-3 subunit gamma/tau